MNDGPSVSGPAASETSSPGVASHEADSKPEPRVLLDAMCGKLATHLRICGYDAAYALDRGIESDEGLREFARDEGRTLLTRDRELAARTDDSVLLDSRDVRDQLRELAGVGFALGLDEPTRCGRCNGRLEPVDGHESTPEYAPDPATEQVWRCEECDQRFWKGSHWERVAATLADL